MNQDYLAALNQWRQPQQPGGYQLGAYDPSAAAMAAMPKAVPTSPSIVDPIRSPIAAQPMQRPQVDWAGLGYNPSQAGLAGLLGGQRFGGMGGGNGGGRSAGGGLLGGGMAHAAGGHQMTSGRGMY